MTAPFSGGCACGSIRYICSRAPVAMLNCHCLDCQRSSGSPLFTRGETAPGVMSRPSARAACATVHFGGGVASMNDDAC
jgi:hypothetical protein